MKKVLIVLFIVILFIGGTVFYILNQREDTPEIDEFDQIPEEMIATKPSSGTMRLPPDLSKMSGDPYAVSEKDALKRPPLKKLPKDVKYGPQKFKTK